MMSEHKHDAPNVPEQICDDDLDEVQGAGNPRPAVRLSPVVARDGVHDCTASFTSHAGGDPNV